MRVVALLALLALAGCDQPPVQPVSETGEPASALQTEAEKACAEMTNSTPERMASMSAQTKALVKREFQLCVAEVTKGEVDDALPAEAPGLRGHTEAPGH